MKKRLSVIIGVITAALFSLILMSCLASADSNAVVVKMNSQQTRKDSGIVLLDPTKEQGAYKDNVAENALQLTYEKHIPGKFGAYRTMMKFLTTNKLTSNTWMTVTYKTTAKSGEIVLTDNAAVYAGTDGSVVLCKNVGVSDGKWVTTEPVQIAGGVLDRFNRGAHNTLHFTVEGENEGVYISEVCFFKSKEDAKAYKPSITAAGTQSTDTGATPPTSPTVSADGTAIIVKMSSKQTRKDSNVILLDPTKEQGAYADNAAENALQLIYEKHIPGKFGAYRTMMKFLSTNKLTSNTWMTVTYKTTAKSGKIMLADNSKVYSTAVDGVDVITLCDNVGVSAGTWVTTEPVQLAVSGSGILDRFNRGAHNTLHFTIDGENEGVYISEVCFFESKEAATAYVPGQSESNTQGSDVATTTPSVSDIPVNEEPVIVKLNNELERIRSSIILLNPTQEQGAYKDNSAENALQLTYEKHIPGKFGAYRIMLKFAVQNKLPVHTWATVTFKTTAKSGEIVLADNAAVYAGNGGCVTLCNNVGVSGGEWVTTEPVQLNITDGDLLGRFNRCAHNTLYFSVEGENEEVYVSEIRFFTSKEEADAYDPTKVVYSYDGEATAVSAMLANMQTREASSVYLNPPDAENGAYVYNYEEDALQLTYEKHIPGKFGAYRFMMRFTKQNMLPTQKWATVTFKTDTELPGSIILANNAKVYGGTAVDGVDKVTLCHDVRISGGEWITSEPVYVGAAGSDILTRFNNVLHNTLSVTITGENETFLIKEITFFDTREEALAYRSNNNAEQNVSHNEEPVVVALTESSALVSKLNLIDERSSYLPPVFNSEESALELQYCDVRLAEADNISHGTYAYRMKFALRGFIDISPKHKYVCVTYKSDSRGKYGLDLYDMSMRTSVSLTDDISLSAGEWKVTYPAELPSAICANLIDRSCYVWLNVGTVERGIRTFIKEIAFFATKEEALEYYKLTSDVPTTEASLTVCGTPITAYTVVYPEGNEALGAVARVVADAIYSATGTAVPVTSDASAVAANEILIGNTNRTESRVLYDADKGYFANPGTAIDFTAQVENGKLLIGADVTAVLEKSIKSFVDAYLCARTFDFVEDFIMTSYCDDSANIASQVFGLYPFNDQEVSFDTPNTYKDSFDGEAAGESPDYWVENPIDKGSFPVRKNTVEFTSYTAFMQKAMFAGDVQWSDVDGVYNHFMGSWEIKGGYTELYPKNDGMIEGGYYRIPFITQPGVVTNKDKYMTVTYKIEAPTELKGTLELRMNENFIVLSENIGDTNGEWITSTPVDITTSEQLFKRWLDSTNHNAICFNFGKTNEDIKVYIKHVEFLDSSDVQDTDSTAENAQSKVLNLWNVVKDGDNLTYGTKNEEATFTWLHAFERNIDYTAKMKLLSGENAKVGIVGRMNSETAYVFAGYDAVVGAWVIESRQGADFLAHNAYSAPAVLDGNWHILRLVLNENVATLYVDGTAVVTANGITHVSPGKPALFARDAEVLFDDIDLTLTSCQGRVEKAVAYSYVLPNGVFTEGGTVLPLNNGELLFLHQTSQYLSLDNGLSWEPTEWAEIRQHANVLRLASGKILRLEYANVNGSYYFASALSDDEGETWSTPYLIAPHKFNGTTGSASIMNDKFMQMSDGRIFFSLTYNNVNGRVAHVEIYYSDDEGKTWTKSQTSTLDLTTDTRFAESKILETSVPGTLRMLTTWSTAGYMQYSESKDNGVTWGELVRMEDFKCYRSSFDVFRDTETGVSYMVWVYNDVRTRLGLARSVDGINWEYCMDILRQETPVTYNGVHLNHIVDPFVKVVGDYVVVGTGFAQELGNYEFTDAESDLYHKVQREELYFIKKNEITSYGIWPNTNLDLTAQADVGAQ